MRHSAVKEVKVCIISILSIDNAGWPRTLENRENRENGEKKNPCRENSGNLKFS